MAEGTFAVLKRGHKLNKIQKRGLQKAIEECLLSATALNLKTAGKSGLNNRIYQLFYGISRKHAEINTEKVSLLGK